MGDRARRCSRHAGIALLLAACASAPADRPTLDDPPGGLTASSAALYDQYGAAIRTPRREAIAGFYHPVEVVRVLNGVRRATTRAELDSVYRGPWDPPGYFSWEQLTYDSLAPGLVLVSGGFLWKGKSSADTARFLYTAILQATDSGMTIRFEAETIRPPR